MRTALGLLTAVTLCLVRGVAHPAPGSLDPTFGTGGKVITPIGASDDVAYALIQQTDGKLVAAGYAVGGPGSAFTVVRYNLNGTLDTSFGTSGGVATFFGSGDVARALLQQTDGKLVAAGFTFNGITFDFALARYHPNGSLDASFGTGGKVTTPIGSPDSFAFALVQQTDGKLVAAGGGSLIPGDSDFALVRYNTDGSLDGSFGIGGKVTTPVGALLDSAFALVLQPDGKLVAAGYTQGALHDDFALVRYNTNGTPDPLFGTAGKVTTSVGTSDAEAQTVLRQADGKLVAAGRAKNGANDEFALVRYNTDGSLDGLFGTGGKVTTQVGASDSFPFAIVQQSDGKLVVAGAASDDPSDQDVGLARYHTNGSLDAFFGAGGKVTTAIGAGNDTARALIQQTDGTLVVAGESHNGTSYDFMLARYFHTCVDPDVDGVCADVDNCLDTPNPGQQDGDDDGLGDACDVCTGSVAAAKPKIVVGKLLAPGGDDKLTVKGDVTFAHPFSPAIAPVTNGFRVTVTGTSGTLLDATIPGGAYDLVTKTGWKVNTTVPVSKWTYLNATAAPGTVSKVVIVDKSLRTPGVLHIVVTAKNGSFTGYAAATPLDALLVLDPPFATTGQCGALDFAAPACTTSTNGNVFVCK